MYSQEERSADPPFQGHAVTPEIRPLPLIRFFSQEPSSGAKCLNSAMERAMPSGEVSEGRGDMTDQAGYGEMARECLWRAVAPQERRQAGRAPFLMLSSDPLSDDLPKLALENFADGAYGERRHYFQALW
jgi:hypothetical protein